MVTNNSISLVWSQPDIEGNSNNITETSTTTEISTASSLSASGQATTNADIDFIVQYGKVNNMTMYETVAKLENVSIYHKNSITIQKQQSSSSILSSKIFLCKSCTQIYIRVNMSM